MRTKFDIYVFITDIKTALFIKKGKHNFVQQEILKEHRCEIKVDNPLNL
jgi:hypothetical protein